MQKEIEMKHLLLLLVALCLIIGEAGAQRAGMEIRPGNDVIVTLDSTDTDTINMGVYSEGYQGFPQLWMNPNSVKASGSTDSLSVQYRPACGGAKADTFANMSWKTATTWKFGAADENITYFDWADSGWYHIPLDWDGQIPSYIQIKAGVVGNVDENDSAQVRFILKDAK